MKENYPEIVKEIHRAVFTAADELEQQGRLGA